MSPRLRNGVAITSISAVSLLGLAACADDPEKKEGAIGVTATDDKCDVEKKDAEAGAITFTVKNEGTRITEFYVYATKDRIMGEVENITPGSTGELIVKLPAGEYETACKPGMVGDGIRGDFTVTGEAKDTDNVELKAAGEDYELYVKSETDELIKKTDEFVKAVKDGDIEQAKHLFPRARVHWERIEPVAEMFAEYDPKIDGREADMAAEGMEFTGFHRIEKALWVENDVSQMGPVADQLKKDIKTVVTLIQKEDIDALQIMSGAKELLDEIINEEGGKITGEEDEFSHTDLWDINSNLEGSQRGVESLREFLKKNDKKLLAEIDKRTKAANGVMAKLRTEDGGFKSFTDVTQAERKEIVDTITVLKEEIAKVPGVISKNS